MKLSRTRILVLVVGCCGLLVVAVLGVSLMMLNSQWPHDKLIAKAEAALDAELTIESIEFQPLLGRATLSGVHGVRAGESSELDARVDDVRLDVAMLPPLYHHLSIHTLELVGPEVRCERTLPA